MKTYTNESLNLRLTLSVPRQYKLEKLRPTLESVLLNPDNLEKARDWIRLCVEDYDSGRNFVSRTPIKLCR